MALTASGIALDEVDDRPRKALVEGVKNCLATAPICTVCAPTPFSSLPPLTLFPLFLFLSLSLSVCLLPLSLIANGHKNAKHVLTFGFKWQIIS